MESQSQSPDGSTSEHRENERPSIKQVGFKTETESETDEVDEPRAAPLEEDAKPSREPVETADKKTWRCAASGFASIWPT